MGRLGGPERYGTVAELFAGVGGFRLGLEGRPDEARTSGGWQVVWSNQWEPSTRNQDASAVYEARFGASGHVNEDIATYLDWAVDGKADTIPAVAQKQTPPIDLVVGGFPCQDYSVAKPLSHSEGLAGKKGVLWWEINRFLEWQKPTYVLLENVDRLLKSPGTQRGRDFAVILSCFLRLGYQVQWRIINAADYGFPQRRRRVFILAERTRGGALHEGAAHTALTSSSVLARAFPVEGISALSKQELSGDPYHVSNTFGVGATVSAWGDAGVMRSGTAFTAKTSPPGGLPSQTLGDILVAESDVPDMFFILPDQEPTWSYLKGAKREQRTSRSGHTYEYAEGAIAYPDPTGRPARTILTGEGGGSPSRFKHVVRTPSGRLRRLVPVELERLQGFPDGWTERRPDGSLIPDGRRAFFMGNALVVGVVHRIGRELAAAREAARCTVEG